MRLTRAEFEGIDLEPLRPYAAGPEFFGATEHYRLLAYLSSLVPPGKTIVDIGTHQGDSALALSSGGRFVESFDVEDRMAGRQRPAGVRYNLADLFDPATRETWRHMLRDSGLIFIDIDPHEGTREYELVRWLQQHEYRGIVVLDDIWYFKPMRDNLWYRIEPQHRTDATAFGHWSGTGIVSFGGRVELENEPDTSNWTLVTGYFDLTGKPDASPELRARPATHYIDQHGSSVLSLDKNLVVFCEPENERKIWALRPNHLHERTRVVVQSFEDFPLTRYRERIVANRGGPWCPTDPRNTASYYLFCMARYAMLKRAIADNPFESTHFAWINICIERMGFKNLIHLDEALGLHRDRFSTCFIDYVSRKTVEDLPGYFGGKACIGRCSMCSGFFTGNAHYMRAVCNELEGEFLRCLDRGFGHADEQLYPIVYHKHPELFDWYVGDYAEMITNYAAAYDRPEQPINHLVRNSLAAGDREVAGRAAGIVLASHDAGRCSLGDRDLAVLRAIFESVYGAPKAAASAPPPRVTLVSALFRLRDRAVDEDEQFQLFGELALSGMPIILFLDRKLADRAPTRPNVHVELWDLETLWPFQQSDNRPLPAVRSPEKDTRDFLLLQNAKLDLLELACALDPAASHFAWIDFGVMKVVRRANDFRARLRALDPPPTCVLAPGCWGDTPHPDPNRVNWRFCGGFLLADRASIPALVAKHREVLAQGPVLTWEVNVWAEMERVGQRFDWYRADHDDSLIGFDARLPRVDRPRICLNMIVKNESAIIARCLAAALPFIDTWAIIDTGSTDGTPELIERFFAERGVAGRLEFAPFEDFAQARNAALDAARAVDGWDYTLLIDADMVLDGTLDKSALTGPAYRLMQRNSSQDYWNVRLVRRNAPARYVGVTHEYVSVEGATDLLGLTIDDRNDGGAKGDKAERDIQLLDAGLAREPDNARYMYYLANTYRETGRHREAIRWYQRRIAQGGWDEEMWSSYYSIARCHLEMKAEAPFIQACLDAYNFRPTRGEPLKLLARFYRERGQNEAALLIADALSAINYPSDALFVERDVYDFGADQEIAIAGYYSPRHRDAGYRACARLTVHPNNWVREEARKNFTFYARSTKELFGAEVREIDWAPGDGYKPMNPSVCVADDRRLVLVRTVNYTVTSSGQYPTLDGSGIIRTRNHILEMDADWRPVRSTRIEEDDGPRSKYPVEGFEDCRLWRSGEQFFVSATVRDRSDDGRCEMAIAALDEAWRTIAVTVIRDYEPNRP
jgi:glycosyltransferase involved in cell wall biosynthesis